MVRIVLLSNDSTKVFPNNTLTEFTNTLPINLPFKKRFRSKAKLESISFHCNFTSLPPEVSQLNYHIAFAVPPNYNVRKILKFPSITSSVGQIVNFFNERYRQHVNFLYMKVYAIPNTVNKFGINLFYQNCRVYIHKNVLEWLHLLSWSFDGTEGDFEYVEASGADRVDIFSQFAITFTPKRARYIRLEMDNVLSNKGTEKLNKTIALFKIPKDYENSYFNYEPVQSEPFAINLKNSRDLTFKLVDEKGEKLNLLPGQATVIALAMGGRMESSFMLRLSTLDANSYGKNSNCRIFLREPLNLGDHFASEWEVALTSIHFTSRFKKHIRNPELPYDFGIRLLLNVEEEKLSPNDPEMVFRLEEADFATHSALVMKMNSVVQNQYMNFEWRKLFSFTMEGNHLILTCENDPSSPQIQPFLFWMTPELGHILGFKADVVYIQKHNNVLDFPHKIIRENERISSFIEIDNDRLFPHHLLLYTDIIRPSVFGSNFLKILKYVPITKKERFYSYESERLIFVPLEFDYIPSIEFQLTNVAGYPTEFFDEKSEIMYNLLFRLRK